MISSGGASSVAVIDSTEIEYFYFEPHLTLRLKINATRSSAYKRSPAPIRHELCRDGKLLIGASSEETINQAIYSTRSINIIPIKNHEKSHSNRIGSIGYRRC
jgi:hypothetical protein